MHLHRMHPRSLLRAKPAKAGDAESRDYSGETCRQVSRAASDVQAFGALARGWRLLLLQDRPAMTLAKRTHDKGLSWSGLTGRGYVLWTTVERCFQSLGASPHPAARSGPALYGGPR